MKYRALINGATAVHMLAAASILVNNAIQHPRAETSAIEQQTDVHTVDYMT